MGSHIFWVNFLDFPSMIGTEDCKLVVSASVFYS